MKKLIVSTALILGAVLLLLFGLRYYKPSPKFNIYKLESDQVVDYEVSGSDLLYITATDAFKYDLQSHESKIVGKSQLAYRTSVIIQDADHVVICEYQNVQISTPTETATFIIINQLSTKDFQKSEVQRYDTTKTVKPIYCDSETIIAIDNYPGDLGRIYEFNLANHTETQISDIPKKYQKENSLKIKDLKEFTIVVYENQNYQINVPNIFEKAFHINDGFILEDYEGELWIAKR